MLKAERPRPATKKSHLHPSRRARRNRQWHGAFARYLEGREVRCMNHFLGGVRRLRAAVRDFVVEVLNDRFWDGCGRDFR